ncbi:COG1615 family transporter [Nocardioides sp. W3-2-3]|nr:COG1615 family transporter [Nocardioides convexus]
MRDTFQQRQRVRGYYSVPAVLDVDRYTIDKQEVPLVLGLRELDQAGIQSSDQNWSNLHTEYTHGEGLIAAYGNRINIDDQANGRIQWAEGIRGEGNGGGDDLTKAGKFETRIYYGEKSPSYSIVGKADAKANDVEPEPAEHRRREGLRAPDHDVRRQGRRAGRRHLQPGDVRHQVRRAELPALRAGQQELQGALQPHAHRARGEGRAVADARRRPVPRGGGRQDRVDPRRLHDLGQVPQRAA